MREIRGVPPDAIITPFVLYGIKCVEVYCFRKDGSIKLGWCPDDINIPSITVVLDNAWYDGMLKRRDASYEAIDICSRCKNEEILRYARQMVAFRFYEHYSTGVYTSNPGPIPKDLVVFNPTEQGV